MKKKNVDFVNFSFIRIPKINQKDFTTHHLLL